MPVTTIAPSVRLRIGLARSGRLPGFFGCGGAFGSWSGPSSSGQMLSTAAASANNEEQHPPAKKHGPARAQQMERKTFSPLFSHVRPSSHGALPSPYGSASIWCFKPSGVSSGSNAIGREVNSRTTSSNGDRHIVMRRWIDSRTADGLRARREILDRLPNRRQRRPHRPATSAYRRSRSQTSPTESPGRRGGSASIAPAAMSSLAHARQVTGSLLAQLPLGRHDPRMERKIARCGPWLVADPAVAERIEEAVVTKRRRIDGPEVL